LRPGPGAPGGQTPGFALGPRDRPDGLRPRDDRLRVNGPGLVAVRDAVLPRRAGVFRGDRRGVAGPAAAARLDTVEMSAAGRVRGRPRRVRLGHDRGVGPPSRSAELLSWGPHTARRRLVSRRIPISYLAA